MLKKFIGNCPSNVSKDAKYSLRHFQNELGVGLVYEFEDEEIWRPVNHQHPKLVEMVDTIKTEVNGASGGQFYINEFRQVIVPAGESITNYYAGEYHEDLEFIVDEYTLTGKPINLNGNKLFPGDTWEGPHPGIPYILEAGGKDIRYEYDLTEDRTRRVKLSKKVGTENASQTAKKIASVKGPQGGRFYINEHRSMFTPLESNNGWGYIYIGQLNDKDPWFEKGDYEYLDVLEEVHNDSKTRSDGEYILLTNYLADFFPNIGESVLKKIIVYVLKNKFITLGQINNILGVNSISEEQFEQIMNLFSENGLNIIKEELSDYEDN